MAENVIKTEFGEVIEPRFAEEIDRQAAEVMNVMSQRASEADMKMLHKAYELARKAHAPQKRKTGEPYILHPIAVAKIAASELHLEPHSVMAAFLHDVVEDTPYTIDDINRMFGNDVAFLVRVVTKEKKEKYEMSKQVDNFKQMLDSIKYDIRALLIKLADRLHNMRTLSSMPPDKQMKIAGETDYFYAPLATRLGLYNVKTELENLSLKFRVPHEYEQLVEQIKEDKESNEGKLKIFTDEIYEALKNVGIETEVKIVYRQPYSLFRKMQKYGDDFNHLKYRHFIDIIYDVSDGMSEKNMALRIYSTLTDRFKEKPGGILNYIDSPKENGYQSFHLKLLADFGRWQEVHISSRRMVVNSQLGCIAERREENIGRWIEKFKGVLREQTHVSHDSNSFIENIVSSFYNDDILTFTPGGTSVVLPKGSTVIDFAFEIHTDLGLHARYATINGRLASVKTQLSRGDVVEIFTDATTFPTVETLRYANTYKARKYIRNYLSKLPTPPYMRCKCCNPIPDEEVIGYKNPDGEVILHKRDCPIAIKMASQHGDNIKSVSFTADATLYPVEIEVRAVDRYHLMIDLVDCITNTLNLSIDSINTTSEDAIVTCKICLGVHSFTEIKTIIKAISEIEAVDEVKVKGIRE